MNIYKTFLESFKFSQSWKKDFVSFPCCSQLVKHIQLREFTTTLRGLNELEVELRQFFLSSRMKAAHIKYYTANKTNEAL